MSFNSTIKNILVNDEFVYFDFVYKNLINRFLENCDDLWIDLRTTRSNIRKIRMHILKINGYTLEEIADEYELSKERVRQILQKTKVRISFEEILYGKCTDQQWIKKLIDAFVKIDDENFRDYLLILTDKINFVKGDVVYETYDDFSTKFINIFSQWLSWDGYRYFVKDEYRISVKKEEEIFFLNEKFNYKKRHPKKDVIEFVSKNKLWKTPTNEELTKPFVRSVMEKLKRHTVLASLSSENSDLTIMPPISKDEILNLNKLIESKAIEMVKKHKIISFKRIYDELVFEIEKNEYFSSYYDENIKMEQLYLIFKNNCKFKKITMPRYPTLVYGENVEVYYGLLLYFKDYIKDKQINNEGKITIDYSSLISKFEFDTALQFQLNNLRSRLEEDGILNIKNIIRGWQSAEYISNIDPKKLQNKLKHY